MDSNIQLPNAAFRSVSTTSNLSLNSSSTSITRVASGPLQGINLNKQSSAQDHLYYQCLLLKDKLSKIEGMQPFMNLAYNAAEQCAEQQALALSQQLQQDKTKSSEYRDSFGSARFSIHSDASSGSNLGGGSKTPSNNNIFTFTAGVLPTNKSVDPATQLWKLFQQGSPLCVIFNAVMPEHKISVIGSDDLRVCKKSVYDFLIAVQTHVDFEDDMMFTISNVFSDNTHDLLKIIKVVNKLLSLKSFKEPPSFSLEDLGLGELSISDERSKVFKEIVETERKYVQDLELMSLYKSELSNAELISSEQVHILFPYLSEIVDFQRRFLNALECNINVPYKYQRIGSIFLHAASGPFKMYEPWTIGQLSAIELINKEASNLKKSSTLLDPGFELQAYILKPIQRLCKYPLLLKELIKSSPESQDGNVSPSAPFNELVIADAAMREVANQVNEAQRRAENVGYLQNLMERVTNWRGFNLKDQGELLYHNVVKVRDTDSEKEYFAYLFDKIIFFFVQANKENGKDKEKKKREILSSRKKSASSASASTANLLESLNGVKDKSLLDLKGRVYISEIYSFSSSNQNGYTLVISWSGKKESGSFTLKYRTEEQRNQWETCLRGLKTNEINTQIHKKVRDSHDSQFTNDYSAYDSINSTPIAGNSQMSAISDSASFRSSNGSYGQRHNSSSSTFSMMKQSKTKSADTPLIPSNGSLSNHIIRIRVIYNSTPVDDVLTVPSSIQFGELYSKIATKIVTSSSVRDDVVVSKLKYKDEDGDFVVMDSNDDWNLAIDMLNELTGSFAEDERSLTVWVS